MMQMALIKCSECGNEISVKAKSCPMCGSPQKKKTSALTWTVLIGFVLYALYGNKGFDDAGSSSSSAKEPSARQVVKNNLHLEYKWAKAGFGAVMDADFIVTNNSDYDIKDIDISCVHFAKSGTRIDSNRRTIYEIFPANSKKTIKKFSMGFIHSQAVRSDCTITDFDM